MLYFGSFGCYEDYYAIGSNPEEVKKILWKMYANNFCRGSKPTKEDRRDFEEVAYVEEVKAVEVFGYNTKCGDCFTLQNNRLKRLKGKVIE